MQAAFQKKPRLQKKNELDAEASASVELITAEPALEEAPVVAEPIASREIVHEESVELPSEPEPTPPPQPPEPAKQVSKKIYNSEERQALAEEMLPPDVLEYLKEEFRAQFSAVRNLSDRKLYKAGDLS